ncbi:regulatory iron-sulfur-containing complex subunit RicT [Lactovum miscens]|uniref:Cell fate regulator YaaT (PSP1 superfamily) n=1 Tax=Lactovum miscens TaxID=190387 RepID=A0A841C8G2_9LACT|nr:regulatory iron-sulfur-containing complex subunit RicT [Lactovum miscens]MBB5887689.1 cell fate regulator YaaT (PSP1 superfamily) [Lactovum miscens]
MIYQINFSNGLPSFLANSEITYVKNDEVIIKSDKATYFGKIGRILSGHSSELDLIENQAKVLRLADENDRIILNSIYHESIFAKEGVREIVVDSGLAMKVVTVTYNFDQSFLYISFTAENRVDFRQLLKDLASHFQTRIELRQIGSRDETKLFGGIGPCGRPLCCSEFLYEFPSVSIKMAKNQQLAFNQGKLNGMCGRLMCCLSYEDDFYKQAAQEFPDFGGLMKTSEGLGKVIGMNILGRSVKLRFDDFVREYSLDELLDESKKEVAHV